MVSRKEGCRPFLFLVLWEIERRLGCQWKTGWLIRLWKTVSNVVLNPAETHDSFVCFSRGHKHVTTFHLASHLNVNKSWFEPNRIHFEPISGRSYLHLCQATCIVLLSVGVLAPAGPAWSDFRPGLTCQLLLFLSLYTGLRPVTDGQPAVYSKRLASKDIQWCLFFSAWNSFWQDTQMFIFSSVHVLSLVAVKYHLDLNLISVWSWKYN